MDKMIIIELSLLLGLIIHHSIIFINLGIISLINIYLPFSHRYEECFYKGLVAEGLITSHRKLG